MKVFMISVRLRDIIYCYRRPAASLLSIKTLCKAVAFLNGLTVMMILKISLFIKPIVTPNWKDVFGLRRQQGCIFGKWDCTNLSPLILISHRTSLTALSAPWSALFIAPPTVVCGWAVKKSLVTSTAKMSFMISGSCLMLLLHNPRSVTLKKCHLGWSGLAPMKKVYLNTISKRDR